MFPHLLKTQLSRYMDLQFDNQVRLVSEKREETLVDGTPVSQTTQIVHWQGEGSIQYVRPRIQKPYADETAGTMEDNITIVCYLPYESHPEIGMKVVDVDGVAGDPGSVYVQSRVPANVGGADVYWEIYIGQVANG